MGYPSASVIINESSILARCPTIAVVFHEYLVKISAGSRASLLVPGGPVEVQDGSKGSHGPSLHVADHRNGVEFFRGGTGGIRYPFLPIVSEECSPVSHNPSVVLVGQSNTVEIFRNRGWQRPCCLGKNLSPGDAVIGEDRAIGANHPN